jgi:hypothetical protein
MDVAFLPRELRHLDEANVELCACAIWTDERPIRGLAGLLDWRLAGRLSVLLKSGFMKGTLGEALLVPGKPHVPFEKLLVMGMGPRRGFDEGVFRATLSRIGRALERLRVRRAVVELPGRSSDAIEADRAVTLALECVGASPDHDTWWLVDAPAAQARIEAHAVEQRRRARSL